MIVTRASHTFPRVICSLVAVLWLSCTAAWAQTRSLENGEISVSVDPAGRISVTTKADGRVWTQAPARSSFRNLRPGPDNSLTFDTGEGTNAVIVTLQLRQRGTDLFFSVDAPNRAAPIRNLFPLEPFLIEPVENAAVVIADYANGHLYPLDQNPLPRTWWDLWAIDMPFVGVCDLTQGHGYAIIVETDDDATIRLHKVKPGSREVYAPQVGFQPSHGTFGYTRRFFYHFAGQGGYVALAKRFRAWAQERGLLVTLAEKAQANPNVTRLFGAPDVWGDATLAFAREARRAGVEKMLIHGRTTPADMRAINELGYLTSDYDNYCDITPVERGGGVDASHGYLPTDAVLKADNTRMKAWLTWDKQQYMKRCPQLWIPAAQRVIPRVIAERPYLGRFIDVTTAEDLYECYDPAHRLTRGDKRQCGLSLLGYVRSLGLVTGGEHGRYWAVPHLHYIEGMQSGGSYSWPAGWLKRPKVKNEVFQNPYGGQFGTWSNYAKWGIGAEYRVPLWELVFHDCVISTWYWGDSSDFLLQAAPEVTARKDAFNILYGTIPLLWANKEGSWQKDRDMFLRTYRNTCKLHEVVAGTEMLSHEFLTRDRQVQRTRFSDGTEVVVNFGRTPYAAVSGGRTFQLPENGWVARGLKIDQSRTIENGAVKTSISSGRFQFSEPR
jgi:hypothetical protein